MQADWITLVPEHDRDVLEWAACVNQTRLILCYLRDVKVSIIYITSATFHAITAFSPCVKVMKGSKL